MKKLLYPLAFSAALAIAGCSNSSPNANDTSDTAEMALDTMIATDPTAQQVAERDTEFADKAAIGGMAEVELGQLALEKASSAKVKDFASMMVNDHSKANEELKAIATARNLVLPTSLDAAHARVKEELTAKQGAEFDKAYVKAMVDGHQKTFSLMEEGTNNNKDAALKEFAAKTAPVVKHHLDMILKIQSELK